MSRLLTLISVAVAIVVVVVLLKLTTSPVAGQSTTAAGPAGSAATAGPVPKTRWGDPDLQGIWTNIYEVPLQRPSRFANKEFLTEEEIAESDAQRGAILGQDRRHDRGSERDVAGAYNTAIFLSHKPTGRRTSLITDPSDGRIPPLTPEAMKRSEVIREFQVALLQATYVCKDKLSACEGGKYGPPSSKRNEAPPYYLATVGAAGGGIINRSDGPEDRTLGERCMAATLPDLGGPAGFFPQIVQSRGAVSIFYDTGQGQGWQRVIPISDRPHLPSQVRQWWGDARGRWEGETLVVDVTNFTAKTDYQGSRENLHLVERFTRRDANTLEYVVTMEDPTTWTRPWTARLELTKQSDKANRHYKEPRCHEGNYGMPALLGGARAEERAFKQGKGPDPATLCSAGCGG